MRCIKSPRGTGATCRPQAAAGQAVGCGVQHPRHSARVRAEDGRGEQGTVCRRVRELAAGHAMLERITEPMLRAHEALRTEYARLLGEMLAIVKPDPVCRRLVTCKGL